MGETLSIDVASPCNLLTDPLIETSRAWLTLPGLLAAMTRGEVSGFPALRPHQRPAWHMFLVQLAALALSTANRTDPPANEQGWADLLRGLTPRFQDDEPWCLVVSDRSKPAFLQPPDPGGLNWSPVETPDALDMLITSRNHDLKRAIALRSAPQDWLFALVSLQTGEGYGGAGNQAIARMNGGSSSRSMVTLAPAAQTGADPHPSRWWARDLAALLTLRAEGRETGPCAPGGKTLLWCLDWPEGQQLDVVAIDPWFIEVCRRIRLTEHGAQRTTSSAARIDARQFNGALGDPWAPVHATEGKALTLGEGDFDYRRLTRLLYSGDWIVPPLAEVTPEDSGDLVLVAEALSRGNSKTDGFKSRTVPIARAAVRSLFSIETANLSAEMLEDIGKADQALRDGLAMLAARGDRAALDRKQYSAAAPARAAFDQRVDKLFFPALWDRIEATRAGQGPQAVSRFRNDLVNAATEEFQLALPSVRCSSLLRPRALARAERAFRARLRRDGLVIDKGERDDEA